MGYGGSEAFNFRRGRRSKNAHGKTGINAEQLIILGHSEGTILAVETAILLGQDIRGLLLLSAQARSMKEMLHYQIVESRAPQKSGTARENTTSTGRIRVGIENV